MSGPDSIARYFLSCLVRLQKTPDLPLRFFSDDIHRSLQVKTFPFKSDEKKRHSISLWHEDGFKETCSLTFAEVEGLKDLLRHNGLGEAQFVLERASNNAKDPTRAEGINRETQALARAQHAIDIGHAQLLSVFLIIDGIARSLSGQKGEVDPFWSAY